jgi:hypothetical protein
MLNRGEYTQKLLVEKGRGMNFSGDGAYLLYECFYLIDQNDLFID